MAEPAAEPGSLPRGYGAAEEGQLQGWARCRERLEQAQNYWISTASPGGRPHAAPIWGAWVGDRLYFEGSPETRWGRNLVANPIATVHLESGSDVLIVEGRIEDVDAPDPALAKRVADAFAAKYNGYRTQGLGFFVLVPTKAMAWASFPKDLTRFRWG